MGQGTLYIITLTIIDFWGRVIVGTVVRKRDRMRDRNIRVVGHTEKSWRYHLLAGTGRHHLFWEDGSIVEEDLLFQVLQKH